MLSLWHAYDTCLGRGLIWSDWFVNYSHVLLGNISTMILSLLSHRMFSIFSSNSYWFLFDFYSPAMNFSLAFVLFSNRISLLLRQRKFITNHYDSLLPCAGPLKRWDLIHILLYSHCVPFLSLIEFNLPFHRAARNLVAFEAVSMIKVVQRATSM